LATGEETTEKISGFHVGIEPEITFKESGKM